MKKIFVITMLLLFTLQAQALTANEYWAKRTYLGAQNRNLDPLYELFGDVDAVLGTSGVLSITNILFSEETSNPTSTEGRMYYNSVTKKFRFYNGTSWVTFEAGGAFASLDEAYQGGVSISVDSGAVTMTATDAANNVVLALVQSDTGTSKGLTLTNAGTGNTIDIQNAQAGTDIEGTDDTWNVATTGVGTFLSFILENSETIKNDTDHEIEFGDNTGNYEDISFVFGNNDNIIGLATDSSADTFDFGVIDSLIGVDDVTFDAAGSDNTITLAGSGAGKDLTIQQTVSAADASLILQSSGTGTDALSLISSVGDIKINSADNIDIDATDDIIIDTAGGPITITLVGGDFWVDATDASIILDSGEAVTDAINIDAAAGGFDLDVALSISLKSTESTIDAIEIVATAGGIDITATGASAGEDIDIVATGSSINITATENNAANIVIQENGGTSAGINIFANQGTGVAASTQHDASIQLHSDDGGIGLYTTSNQGDDIRIETNGGANENIFIQSVQGTGADSITLTSTVGGIAVTANAAGKDVVVSSVLGSIHLKAEENVADAILLEVDGINSSTLRLYAATGTSVAEDGAAIQLSAIAGGIGIQSDANLDDAIVIRADGGTSAEITIHNDQGTTTDSIEIVSDAGGIVLTAGKPVVVTNAFELAYVLIPDGAAYTVLAANSGHTHLIPDQGATITLDLPAEVAGMRYRFVHIGGAEDAQNWVIDTENNANYYIGGIVQHDPDNGGDDTATYYSDGTNDSILTIVTPGTGTDIEIWCNGTQWYVTGTAISSTDTGVTFTNL